MSTVITINKKISREEAKEIAAVLGGYLTMSSPSEFKITRPTVINSEYRFQRARTYNHVNNEGPSAA